MKKILYIAAAATLLMTSCQKTDVLNVVEETIEFDTEVGKLTKAISTDDATLKAQGFRVWAVSDFSLGDDQKGTIYRGLQNLPVEYVEASSNWAFASSVTNKYLWPQAGNKLYFYTVSSKKAANWLADGDKEAVTSKFKFADGSAVGSVVFPEYTVEDTADDDVMVADSIHQHKGRPLEGNTPYGRVVSPHFRHTMTKVAFNFKKGGPEDNGAAEATNIVLKSITTTALQYKGTLTFTYRTATAAASSAWVPTVDKKPFSHACTTTTTTTTYKMGENEVPQVSDVTEVEDPAVGDYCVVDGKLYKYNSEGWAESEDKPEVTTSSTTTAGIALTETSQNVVTWYMIPQTLAASSLGDNGTLTGAVVTITYEADGKTISQNFDLNIPGAADTDKDWAEETCVNYNVTIAPHKIEFKPSVDQWTEQSGNMNN